MKMAQRILSIVGGTFLFQHCTRADYTCGTNNCWNAEGDCCRDTSLLYSGRKLGALLAQQYIHYKIQNQSSLRLLFDCFTSHYARSL